MATLTDLIKAQSKDDVLDALVALLRSAGFPTSSWLPGTVLRHIAEYQAFHLSVLSEDIAAIAASGFLDTAEGGWLDLLAASTFDDTRKAAVFTAGEVLVADTGGVGPVTINPDSYWFQNADGSKRYRNTNTAPIVIPLNGSATLPVRAETAGAAWNLGTFSITTINPSIPGLTVTSPANVSTGTWITSQGSDEETDAALRTRMRDKWSTIGSGSNEGAYRYWATSASSEVTRVRVVGDPATGRVDVTIAGPSGPVSSAALVAAKASVEAGRPVAVEAVVVNASLVTIPIIANLYLEVGAASATVIASAQAAVDAYARSVDIGGTIYASRIIAALQGVSGVRYVALNNPGGELTLAGTQVWLPSYTLTTVLS